MGMNDPTFLQERIDKSKARILLYEDVLAAMASTEGIQSYTFDSGQARQVATRYSIAEVNNMLDAEMVRLEGLCARRNGSGVVTASPSW